MTSLDKLQQLYAASRIALLNADQHEALRQYADEILQAIKPVEHPEPKSDANP
jgi:hypothetical protein